MFQPNDTFPGAEPLLAMNNCPAVIDCKRLGPWGGQACKDKRKVACDMGLQWRGHLSRLMVGEKAVDDGNSGSVSSFLCCVL